MVELSGRLLRKDVTRVREEFKGLVSPLHKPFNGASLNSPSPVHSISLVLKLYYFDIILLPQISTSMCIAYFTIRLTCPVFRILYVAL
jgi:hypothetical protein